MGGTPLLKIFKWGFITAISVDFQHFTTNIDITQPKASFFESFGNLYQNTIFMKICTNSFSKALNQRIWRLDRLMCAPRFDNGVTSLFAQPSLQPCSWGRLPFLAKFPNHFTKQIDYHRFAVIDSMKGVDDYLKLENIDALFCHSKIIQS